VRLALDVTAVPESPVGAGVYTIAIARELHTRTDLHLVARRDDEERWQRIAPSATVHAVAPNRRPARLAWEQLQAPRVARALSATCWHGPHYSMPLRNRVPTVVTIHDMTFFEHPEWHERSKVAFFQRMIRSSVHRASVLIAVSNDTAERIQRHFGTTPPIVVAPHGVDHSHFTPRPHGDAEDLEQLRMLGIRPPYLAFAGTHEPRKNLPQLVYAFSRVASAFPELTLQLAGGDGWGSDQLNRAISESPARQRIHKPGRIPYALLPAFFRQAAAVVYPSLEEGFGLPALESLATGAVLISTTGSAVEEVVADAAVLVKPGNANQLTEAIRGVLTEPQTALRTRGPEVSAFYTWEHSAALHMQAYDLAMERRA
jgi:glycosyltransferase involved in cell wall biosynthesis